MPPLLASVQYKEYSQVLRLGASWKDYLLYPFASGEVIFSTSFSIKSCQISDITDIDFDLQTGTVVSQGCCLKVPPMDWPKQQNVIVSQC